MVSVCRRNARACCNECRDVGLTNGTVGWERIGDPKIIEKIDEFARD
jgi:hypothetical protein